jgi:ABC-2 type transport system permease protein
MTAASGSFARRPARFPALVAYTLRSSVGGRRWLACLAAGAGAVLLGLLARAIDQPAGEAFSRVAAEGIFSLALPVVTLVVGDAVLGSEIRSGVFQVTWLSPTRISSIVLARWFGGWLAALVSVVPAAGLAAVVAGVPEAAGPALLATAAGAGAYVAVFVAIGAIARRAAVWSLAFVFLVERLLGAAVSGVAQLSPSWEARAVFVGLYDEAPSALVRSGVPAGGAGVGRLVLIAAAALVVARWRVARRSFGGPSD